MPIRRLLPRRVRAFYVGHRSTIGFVVLFCAILGAIYVSVQAGVANDKAINGNRVEQTRQSCRERNEERRILRSKFAGPLITSFKVQRAQTERVPAEAFQQFGVAKAEALERLDNSIQGLKRARTNLHPLDCKARVRAVRNTLD